MEKIKHKVNPFYSYLPNIRIKGETAEVEYKPIIDIKSGEITETTLELVTVSQMNINCSAKFVKVLTDNIHLIYGLPAAARRLLDIVMIVVQMEAKDKDYFYLSYEQAKDIAGHLGGGLGRTTFYRAIDRLTESNIIAPSLNKTRYWLNVGVIFNGEYRKLEALRKSDVVHLAEELNRARLTTV